MLLITVQCKTIEEKLPKFQGKYTHLIFFLAGEGEKEEKVEGGGCKLTSS